MRALDTTPEAAANQEAGYRRMGADGRLRAALELSDLVRAFAEAGTRQRRPDLTGEEVTRQLAWDLYHLRPEDFED